MVWASRAAMPVVGLRAGPGLRRTSGRARAAGRPARRRPVRIAVTVGGPRPAPTISGLGRIEPGMTVRVVSDEHVFLSTTRTRLILATARMVVRQSRGPMPGPARRPSSRWPPSATGSASKPDSRHRVSLMVVEKDCRTQAVGRVTEASIAAESPVFVRASSASVRSRPTVDSASPASGSNPCPARTRLVG